MVCSYQGMTVTSPFRTLDQIAIGGDTTYLNEPSDKDYINAVKDTKPSVTQADMDKHTEWTKEYGVEGV